MVGLAGLPPAMPVCASRIWLVAMLLTAFEPKRPRSAHGFSSRQRAMGLSRTFLALRTFLHGTSRSGRAGGIASGHASLRFADLAGRDAPSRIRTQKAALRAWVLIPPASDGFVVAFFGTSDFPPWNFTKWSGWRDCLRPCQYALRGFGWSRCSFLHSNPKGRAPRMGSHPASERWVCRGLFWHFGLSSLELHEVVGLAGLPPAMPVCASRIWLVAMLLPAFEPKRPRSAHGFSSRQRALGFVAAFFGTSDFPPWNFTKWSGWRDSNPRPPAPQAGALPDCATARFLFRRRGGRQTGQIRIGKP
jgi:hypothetical protein